MRRNYDGCALCNATWGDYWREIEGENMFFCCSICADAFQNMIKEVKKETGWNNIDEIHIEGNFSKGRTCWASSNGERIEFFFKHEDGVITEFEIRNRKNYGKC